MIARRLAPKKHVVGGFEGGPDVPPSSIEKSAIFRSKMVPGEGTVKRLSIAANLSDLVEIGKNTRQNPLIAIDKKRQRGQAY